MAIGAIAGAIIAAFLAPLTLRFFSVPDGGVGVVTVHQYPKEWDYAVVAMLVGFSFLGGICHSGGQAFLPVPGERNGTGRIACPPLKQWLLAIVVFLAMVFAHDHPYAFVDMFHDGEHLTPALQMKAGARPYRDIFYLHGIGTDGGLDALVLGNPPSPARVRRMYTILNAAAIALLVPIAAEVCATSGGVAFAALLSIAALGAGQVKVFPYFRLVPILIAAWALLRFAKNGRLGALFVAVAASSLGILWSLDTGTYALAATGVLLIIGMRRMPRGRELGVVVAALALPFLILLILRADVRQFCVDSFVLIPRAIDAVWSLPAPKLWPLTFEGARYYVPLVFYGFLLALGLRAPSLTQRRIAILAIFSIILFRTAAGRVSWSHTRYAMPLLGIAIVAFLLEPLVRRRAWVTAVAVALPFAFLLEVGPNVRDGSKLIAEWRKRQSHEGMVPYPFRTGKGIYTYPADAKDLAALNGFVESLGPDATFLDFSGERALHYFLERRPPIRCPDINMLSSPTLLAEAMAGLNANPPSCVIVEGTKVFREFDGVPYEVRVPDLARWIESRYPYRHQIGRFVVATRQP